MIKTTTSIKRRKSSANTKKPKQVFELKEGVKVTEYSPTEKLCDEEFIAKAVWECFKNNDPEGVIEVIQYHLEAINKVKASKDKDLSRATMYNAFKGKNPTVKTLSKLINCCTNEKK